MYNLPLPLLLPLPVPLPLRWAPLVRLPQVSSEPWHLLRLLCQWRNELEMTILPPYVPSEQEKADPKLYAANVRSLMARALNQPLLPHSNANFIALKKLKVGGSKATLRAWTAGFQGCGAVRSRDRRGYGVREGNRGAGAPLT